MGWLFGRDMCFLDFSYEYELRGGEQLFGQGMSFLRATMKEHGLSVQCFEGRYLKGR